MPVENLFRRIRRNLDGWVLPGTDDRTSIVGKNGSGKTLFGIFLMLQSRLYQKMPWVIFDYKGDDHIQKIPARVIEPRNKPPTEPGLYKMHLDPFDGPEQVNAFLKKLWHNGSTGLFFDEAYMLPDRHGRIENSVLRAIFTTGRSRHIPVISLSQRPVDVMRYNFTEASHHVIFRLNDERDRLTVRSYIPREEFDQAFGGGRSLQRYHSLWYDVNRDLTFEMLPCPNQDCIYEQFEEIAAMKKWS